MFVKIHKLLNAESFVVEEKIFKLRCDTFLKVRAFESPDFWKPNFSWIFRFLYPDSSTNQRFFD